MKRKTRINGFSYFILISMILLFLFCIFMILTKAKSPVPTILDNVNMNTKAVSIQYPPKTKYYVCTMVCSERFMDDKYTYCCEWREK